MAVKVIIRNSCSRISMVIYSFFRVVVSFDRWDWLAISIRGRSHVVRTSRGADSESEKNVKEKLRLFSPSWFSRDRLIRLMRRLCTVALIQIMLCLDTHVMGSSIVVGIIIFSIVKGLSFGRNRYRMCWILLLVVIGPVQLRRLQTLVK